MIFQILYRVIGHHICSYDSLLSISNLQNDKNWIICILCIQLCVHLMNFMKNVIILIFFKKFVILLFMH